MSSIYSQAGVDVDVEKEFSKFCARLAEQTHHNSPFVRIADTDRKKKYFRSTNRFTVVGLPAHCQFDTAPDGIGRKADFIADSDSHRTAGFDLVAMTAGDAVRTGGIALLLVNNLKVRTLGKDTKSEAFRRYCTAMRGLQEAASKEGIVLHRGDTAQVDQECYNPDAVAPFEWDGFVLSACDSKREITGSKLDVGHVIVAIAERGLRSNGARAVLMACDRHFVHQPGGWWQHPHARQFIKSVAEPSVLWARFIATMNGWHNRDFRPIIPMTAIAHITGGGIPEKFGEDILFRWGLSAELEHLPELPGVLRCTQEWLDMPEKDFYETFHGGPGALIVVPTEYHARMFVNHACEWGLKAQIVGKTLAPEGAPELRIKSQMSGTWISYRPK